MDIVIGILLICAAIFLVVAVLLQSGKDKNLSGAIAGGAADTFYGKNKGRSFDSILNKLTTVIAIVFAVLVLVSFVIQDDTDLNDIYDELTGTESTEETSDETSEETSEESTSDTEEDSADDSSSAA